MVMSWISLFILWLDHRTIEFAIGYFAVFNAEYQQCWQSIEKFLVKLKKEELSCGFVAFNREFSKFSWLYHSKLSRVLGFYSETKLMNKWSNHRIKQISHGPSWDIENIRTREMISHSASPRVISLHSCEYFAISHSGPWDICLISNGKFYCSVI